MPWARLDDAMPENDKIAALSDAAFRADVTAICYAARNLTDGFLPMRYARQYANPRGIKELVPSRWHMLPVTCPDCLEKHPKEVCAAATKGDGFYIHDYLEYNPTRAYVEQERLQHQEQKAAGGRARAATAPRVAGGRFASGSTSSTTSDTASSQPAEHQLETQQSTSPVPVPVPDPLPETFASQRKQNRGRAAVRILLDEEIEALSRDPEFADLDVFAEARKFRDHVPNRRPPYKDQFSGFKNFMRIGRDFGHGNAQTRRNGLHSSAGATAALDSGDELNAYVAAHRAAQQAAWGTGEIPASDV